MVSIVNNYSIFRPIFYLTIFISLFLSHYFYLTIFYLTIFFISLFFYLTIFYLTFVKVLDFYFRHKFYFFNDFQGQFEISPIAIISHLIIYLEIIKYESKSVTKYSHTKILVISCIYKKQD